MVIPGSGYHQLAEHEGAPVAERFARAGFDAAVLRHRVSPHRHPAMIHDAKRGVRLMRRHPAIRARRLAVLGFSAGGHLALTLAVHHSRFACADDDLADAVPARPDAVALAYAVIDMAGDAPPSGTASETMRVTSKPDPLTLTGTKNGGRSLDDMARSSLRLAQGDLSVIGTIGCKTHLGGLLRHYYRRAA